MSTESDVMQGVNPAPADAACPCGEPLVERASGTPEQQWCGRWLDHPPIPGLPPGHFVGHLACLLVPSPELAASLEAQAAPLGGGQP